MTNLDTGNVSIFRQQTAVQLVSHNAKMSTVFRGAPNVTRIKTVLKLQTKYSDRRRKRRRKRKRRKRRSTRRNRRR